jgi:chromosome segregation ATPase
MTAHGSTRQRAFAAACTLAAAGKRPTMAAVREALDGKGSQQAIGAGIDDWLDEAARRFQIPGLPEELCALAVQVWDRACFQAGTQWSAAKTDLEGRVADLDGRLAAVAAERDLARAEAEQLAAALATREARLREVQDACDRTRHTLDERNDALRETTAELARARAQGEEQARQREQADRVTNATQESLREAQERRARLETDLEVARARAQLLERAEASAHGALAHARGDLEAAQASVAELRTALSQRDGHVATLTATVQAEQESRDADTQHWLGRLSDSQAVLAEARTREAALIEEKKALGLEVQRLRQDLRGLQAEFKAFQGRLAAPAPLAGGDTGSHPP